jgi:hypothetical protein
MWSVRLLVFPSLRLALTTIIRRQCEGFEVIAYSSFELEQIIDRISNVFVPVSFQPPHGSHKLGDAVFVTFNAPVSV